ncbi:hypothetical protein KUTeg_023192 [Tegillarca granosa]|uniref:Uncharacterized protein n=1 Tax=Tegillarca granosa TaxID=220873 RepID=A0ABQ9E5G7_TEGGR|nr:hypothetical protein KUTeg_023192 [Tegillarca granosa]
MILLNLKVDCCVRLTMDEDEDDFGDFGGFEAAEPVSPNVAQGGPAFPLEANNTVGVKPDLLCGQNKFPPIETLNRRYTDQSNVLNEELKSIRKESHQAVMAVIEEYKDLLKVNLELQKESYDQQLAKAVEEQQKLFQEKFNEQQQKFEQMLKEEKDKMEEEYKVVFNSQAEKQQEERENSIEMVKGILKEEKSKLDEYLQEEMEAIQKAVQEERLRSEETIKVLTDSIKEETIAHLEQQKQLDQVSRRRQLASLDVFLESARRQLTLLMENDSQSSNDNYYPNHKIHIKILQFTLLYYY